MVMALGFTVLFLMCGAVSSFGSRDLVGVGIVVGVLALTFLPLGVKSASIPKLICKHILVLVFAIITLLPYASFPVLAIKGLALVLLFALLHDKK